MNIAASAIAVAAELAGIDQGEDLGDRSARLTSGPRVPLVPRPTRYPRRTAPLNAHDRTASATTTCSAPAPPA